MKAFKLPAAVLFISCVFLIGYLIGKYQFNQPSREIVIAYEDENNSDIKIIKQTIKDTEKQHVIDNFFMIWMQKKPLEDTESVGEGKPDFYIMVNSPKQSVRLINAQIWFTEDGAIIGEEVGGSEKQLKYFSIPKENANYIKAHINNKEKLR
ncbi:hypothetical protein QNH47_10585 [Virgibacillus halodenitrificans]|uniref:hypothetical protein n=1 Tax=Virgibacillus halodenitrificans TaxID=1482 RepID=UPI0024BF682C|nr:hypothetical protein [Virgibacillus halodenitrificans]WHX24639.1 hypothetical protein QNH47_10585 [Virgibacillus halodenitrificans]